MGHKYGPMMKSGKLVQACVKCGKMPLEPGACTGTFIPSGPAAAPTFQSSKYENVENINSVLCRAFVTANQADPADPDFGVFIGLAADKGDIYMLKFSDVAHLDECLRQIVDLRGKTFPEAPPLKLA
jgi:hypothetical protein